MMASTQEESLVAEVYRCYHCGLESTGSSFKYYDNKKVDQPRYQCQHCRKFFTLGWHGRPQGKTYAKKRNEDPAEIKSLSRQCRHCGVADHAIFKYYNNHNPAQPRFKCLSCGKQFQMRLLGTGQERHLVHTSAQRKRAPRRRKQDVLEPFANPSSSSEDGSYQPFDGSFVPMPSDALMPLEPGARLISEMPDGDAQYADLLEVQLAQENTQADSCSWTASGDDGNLLAQSSDEAFAYLQLPEAALWTQENYYEAPNANAFSCTTNLDGELPSTWSNEDAQLMNFLETGAVAPDADMVSDHMGETISESSSNTEEVMYGTLAVDGPASLHSDSWSYNDSSVDASSMSYADAAAACCYQMDMDMARENSIRAAAPVQSIGSECSSSSSAGSASLDSDSWSYNDSSVDASSMSYADAAAACCYQMDMDMAHEKSTRATAAVDASSMSYADAAAACCYQMDMDMAQEKSTRATDPVQSIGSESSSSSSAGSTMVFGDSFHVVPEPLLVQQSLTEDDQCSGFHWNEDDEAEDDTEINSWA